jgi:hypothetical protein
MIPLYHVVNIPANMHIITGRTESWCKGCMYTVQWALPQILGLLLQIGRWHVAQNTTTTSLCWSKNTSSLGQSQESLLNLLATHLYSGGGGLPYVPVSASLSCRPIGDSASRHQDNQNGRDLLLRQWIWNPQLGHIWLILSAFFLYSIQGFIEIYTLWRNTSR